MQISDNRKRPNRQVGLLDPIGLLKDLQLRIIGVERELAEIKARLGLKEPSPEVAEIQNEIAYERAAEARSQGDRTAMKRFLAAGGYLPKPRKDGGQKG